MATAFPSILTPSEVERLSDQSHRLYELIDGQLVAKQIGTITSWICGQVLGLLNSAYRGKAYVLAQQLTHCFADPALMLRPEVVLVWSNRMPQGLTQDELGIAPDLAVDVVPAARSYNDQQERVGAYLTAGVPVVWVVAPSLRSVHVYRREGSVSLLRPGDFL